MPAVADAPTKKNKKQKKVANDLFLAIVLDKSGSMSSCRDATISAFNEYLNDRKEERGKTTVWLTLFDTECTVRANGDDVKSVTPLSRANYAPSGMTALYDAIGRTIREMEGRTKKTEKVLFVIQTDGHENSSREWTQATILALIKEKEAAGNWTFVFLGADQDAFAAGGSIGIGAANTMSYDSADTQSSAQSVSKATANYRRSMSLNSRAFVPDSERDRRRK